MRKWKPRSEVPTTAILRWGRRKQEAHTRWRLEACPSGRKRRSLLLEIFLTSPDRCGPFRFKWLRTVTHHPTSKPIRLSFQSLPAPSNIPQTTSISILPCRTTASNDELGRTRRVIQSFLRAWRRREAVHVAYLRPSASSRRTVPG